MKRPLASRFAVVCVFALFFSLPFASAQQAGYDLLKTGTDASIELPSRMGAPALLPATIPLMGVPICVCTGASDTIMHRGDRHPDGTADLTVVALFLKNSGAVHLGKTPVDVYITVNNSNGVIGQNTVPQPDHLTPSTGTLNIHPDHTFDSDFTVYADVIVVAAGADVRNPATPVLHHGAAPAVHLGAHGSPWSATPPPGYPECFFPGNGFFPGGPVPETDPTNPLHRHPVAPSSPITAVLNVAPSPTGHCPVHIVFNGTITSPPGVSGTYRFLRSDGGIDTTHPPRTFGPGTTTVSTTWDVGGTGLTSLTGWQAIEILTPGPLQSNHATFTMHCTP
ncbi:MAG TPA: hypothetical protein VFQ41_08885 [Candidatus Angelobacter sp.]|nr:hypothetical protein [Candidatus Angelobacter sp.]